jgi:sucrose phosphorylase
MKNKVQLITYPDSLGGYLTVLGNLLKDRLSDVFPGGVHILPPFPSTGDRGFAPTTYREINPAFGTWADVHAIGKSFDVMIDIMVNHISAYSRYFVDFRKQGRKSPFADMFITLDKVWPDGTPPAEDVRKIFLRKPEHPFLDVEIEETGEMERIWASFGPRADYSEQIDLDITSPVTRKFFTGLLKFLSEQNIRQVRLDAIGYVIKKPGTSCFMVEPEIYAFIDWLIEVASGLDLQLLPEVHAHYTTQFKLASHGYWVYDFILPLLTLHTLDTGDASKLLDHLESCPRKQITMLDCHDGIPVQPDLDDILETEEAQRIVDRCLQRGANLNRILSESKREDGFDAHQINITFYDALDKDDDAYLVARAIQFFTPGVPQVYYVGLLAGENDHQGVEATGEGRAINRQNFSEHEIEVALSKDVVQRLIRLIRFRNQHTAFNGEFSIAQRDQAGFKLRWENQQQFCELSIDLQTNRSVIEYSDERGQIQRYVISGLQE